MGQNDANFKDTLIEYTHNTRTKIVYQLLIGFTYVPFKVFQHDWSKTYCTQNFPVVRSEPTLLSFDTPFLHKHPFLTEKPSNQTHSFVLFHNFPNPPFLKRALHTMPYRCFCVLLTIYRELIVFLLFRVRCLPQPRLKDRHG